MIAAAERYRKLIDATLRAALTARLARPMPDGLTMELALPAIADRMGIGGFNAERLKSEAIRRLDDAPANAPVCDGAGQTRSVYEPLLFRAIAPDSVHAGRLFERFAERMIGPTQAFADGEIEITAQEGARVAGRVFAALALPTMLSKIDPVRAGRAVKGAFDRVIAAQSAEGRFLDRISADQLEPAWYHELAVLHAVKLYARRNAYPATIAAVKRSARYHAAEVQPDHASSHPFALAALLGDADGIYLADMMLHAAGVQQPATMDAVSLILLHDAIA